MNKHSNSNEAMKRRKKNGVVILLVLSLLSIFMLLGVTFLLVASQAVVASKSHVRRNQSGDRPEQLHDRAIRELIWNPPGGGNRASSLFGQDISGDLTGAAATLSLPVLSVANNGQFLAIDCRIVGAMSPTSGYYNGCVLTMKSGQLKGLSTRIVEYNVTAPNATFVVERFRGASRAGGNINRGDLFIFNDPPFDGAGAGYNLATGNLTQTTTVSGTPQSAALFPHYAGAANPLAEANAALRGGADESYDAADYQNMYLSMVPAGPTSSAQITPSFHRPALVNYWMRYNSGQLWTRAQNSDFRAARRRILFRPMPWDHPNFDGSNPAFAKTDPDDPNWNRELVNGPWDVDNDGDGITDSIWIDLGFPIATGPDGQAYKPLVAFLVKDLDGLLNINAHGSQQHGDYAGRGHIDFGNNRLKPTNGGPYARPAAGGQNHISVNGNPNLATENNPFVAYGRGFGPAEIYTGHLFNSAPIGQFQSILSARYGDGIPGRAAFDDTLLSDFDTPPNYVGPLANVANRSYGSHPDVWGRQAFAVDVAGGLFSQSVTTSLPGGPNDKVDDPYEIDLSSLGVVSSNGHVDQPYTLAELERLLRSYDHDAGQLPDRLVRLAPGTFGIGSPANQLVTVESRHIPQMKYAGFPELRSSNPGPDLVTPTLYDLYSERMRQAGRPIATHRAIADVIMPMEFLRGQLFNINRRWGNGQRDNNPTNEVDLAAEVAGANQELAFPGVNGAVQMRHTGGDPLIPLNQRNLGRQIYARHLYCLMMLMMDQGYAFPTVEAITPANAPSGAMTMQQRLTADRIAQWAVNVVDARDVDSEMTRFEYDENPFDGWDVTNVWTPGKTIPNHGGVVWGVEYPELIMTSTLATHDRRVRDTTHDPSGEDREGTGADDPDRDLDLDQFRVPEGSLFIELMAMRDPANIAAGRSTPGQMANFKFVHPTAVGGKRYPLWRIAISEHHASGAPNALFGAASQARNNGDSTSFGMQDHSGTNPTPRDPMNMSRVPGQTRLLNIEREIWFTNQNPTTLGFDHDTEASSIFFDINNMVQFERGRITMLGPRPLTVFGGMRPDVGEHVLTYTPSPQYIEIKATNTGNPVDTGVLHYDLTGNRTTPAAGSTIHQAFGAVIAANAPLDWTRDPNNTVPTGIGMNISEPLPTRAGYYDEPTHDVGFPNRHDGYGDNMSTPPIDQLPDTPYDERVGFPLRDLNIMASATYENARTLFLQRLAVPHQPWHPHTNPYITVDWTTVDLTVFNGEDVGHKTAANGPGFDARDAGNMMAYNDLFDPNSGIDRTNNPQFHFRSRERGELINGAPHPWSPITQGPIQWVTATPRGPGDTRIYFRYDLTHQYAGGQDYSTLGYLNSTMWTGGSPMRNYNNPGDDDRYDGSPTLPFAHLYHENAPFATPYDIMLVPASTPARLLYEYGERGIQDETVVPYLPADVNANPDLAQAPYGHLLNFFSSRTTALPGTGSSNFHRVFDFIEVPSRYANTRTWYDPADFQIFGGDGTHAAWFRPPYNYLSRFRDPGRVNFNTMNRTTWEGISKNFPFTDPAMDGGAAFNFIAASRQGYGTAPTLTPDNNIPTRIAQPFRSSSAADLNPIASLRSVGAAAGLLRPQVNNANKALFSLDTHNRTPAKPKTDAALNPRFNPNFHYQGITRLGNIYSTTSNVFAVWTTIGYFEMQPVQDVPAIAGSAVGPGTPYPEGYTLGREVGSDTGEVQRSRAFFILDRSIPVGYDANEIGNAEKIIRLRRYID